MLALQQFLREQLNEIKRKGFFRDVRILEGPQDGVVRMNGRDVIMFGSNNYLGLASHPEVISSAVNALNKFGAGQASVREVSGTTTLIKDLEAKLADFYKMEKALVFASCSTANIGLISSIMSEGSVIFSDQENHASIIDGCRSAKGQVVVIPHNNSSYLAEKIRYHDKAVLKMIVTDGLFSMSGDISPLPDLMELAEQHSAFLAVDEAHAAGVLGRSGKGTPEHYGLEGKIHIITGTLGKTFGGGTGGYVVGSEDLIDYLFHRARSFIFTNAISPATAASALKAIHLLEQKPELVSRLRKNATRIREGLRKIGYDIPSGESAIIPVLTRDTFKTMALSRGLFESGVFAPGIGHPVVPEGQALIRVQASASFDDEIISKALSIFQKVGQNLELI